MKEKVLERYGRLRIEQEGGTQEKFTSPARRNVPDDICSLRKGVVFFAEYKKKGEKPTPGQMRDHARRRARGFRVYVPDTKAAVEFMITWEKFA